MDTERDERVVKTAKENYSEHFLAVNQGGTRERAYRGACLYYEVEVLPLLPEPNDDLTVLDVGFGLGHLLRFLAEVGFSRVGGVEIEEQLYRQAYDHVGDKAEFLICDDATKFLETRKNAFDVITVMDVIEHFTLGDALYLMEQIKEALKPGGIAIFRTPNMANLLGIYSRYMDLTHQLGFTEQSLAQLLRQAGFSEIHVHHPKWRRPIKRAVLLRFNALLHSFLFRLHDRSRVTCYDRNVVLWARK